MSETLASALPGADFRGFVQVRDAGLKGMITLRGDLGSATVAQAVRAATGCAVPEQRRMTRDGDYTVAWMSPDEVLILCPYAATGDTVARLAQALTGEFASVVAVSDARAVFNVTGASWRDALAKVCPVDFSAVQKGDIRRTRAAQVAAAILVTGQDEATVICFRSVAQYVFDLLALAAAPGSEPALYT